MVVKRILSLLLILFGMQVLTAQDLRVSSSLKQNSITMNDQLELILQVRSTADFNLRAPEAPMVSGFSFRNVVNSSSSQVSWVNGVKSSSFTKIFTYFYMPQRKGTFSIPGFSFSHNGRNYATGEQRIRVEDAPPPSSQQQHSFDPWFDPYSGLYPERNSSGGETMLLCIPGSHSVWQGEPVVVSWYLYTENRVDSFETLMEKDHPGYGKTIHEQPRSLNYEEVKHKDRRFQRALIKRSIIYPQQNGRIKLPTLSGRVKFSGWQSHLNRNVDSEDTWLDVKPLPAGKPADFSGAVGSFKVSQSFSSSKISLGEALTCTITISGRGNFGQFIPQQFPKIDNFQISEPGVEDNLKNAIAGTRRIVYTLIPRETGDYEIPGAVFSWFDSSTGSYQVFRGQSIVLKVKQGNVLSYFSGLLERHQPRTLNPLLERETHPNFKVYANSTWFWLVIALCLLSLILAGYFAHEQRLRREDPSLYAQKTANRVLNKYLRQATDAADRLSLDFYPLAESGLTQYLANKYGVSRSLSTSEVIELLQLQDLPSHLIESLEAFFLLCQKARYMPGGAEAANLEDGLLKLRSLVQAFSRHRPENNGKNSIVVEES